jgi:Xaa-Pro aminopeptidase
VINDGDLVLFDLGAKADLYCADISRTYPANGKYSSLQKTIYETVLTANKNVIAMIKPGLTLKDLQDYTIGFYQKELMRLGLIDNPEEVKDVYYHNVSHHLGIDTHDVSDRSLPLEAGNVITVEPGLYFKKYGIGVRIEDDVLVTETGSENLSKEIIKEVADIEKAIQSR